MAVRHQLVRRSPEAVWAVLKDPSRFGQWVVGPSESRPCDGAWPAVGSRLEYTLSIGPWTLRGETVSRRFEEPRYLELEAKAGPLGTARIAFDIRPWGDHTLIVLDEHPLRGLGGAVHQSALDALIQLRHRRMLPRLAKLVESVREPDRAGAAHGRGTGDGG